MEKKKLDIDFSGLVKANQITASLVDFVHPAVVSFIKQLKEKGVLQEVVTTDDILTHVFGFNLDVGYEEEELNHRTRLSGIQKCIRYCGFERYDDEWVKGGPVSEEMLKLRESVIARVHNKW